MMEDFCQYNLFKKPQPNLMIPPLYVRKSESRKLQRRIPTLQLRASDPAKLLLLTESLKETASTHLEVKINKYLLEELHCQVIFMVSLVTVPNEAVIRVINDNILDIDIHMPSSDCLITEIIDHPNGIQFSLDNLNPQLLDVIKAFIPEASGCIYGFPIFEQVHKGGATDFTDKACILVFAVHCNQQKIFVSQMVNETFRFSFPLLVNTMKCEEATRAKVQSQGILMVARRFFLLLNALDDLVEEIVDDAKVLTDAERGSLYLIDEHNQYLVPHVFDGIQKAKPDRVSKSKGILGKVFKTGEIMNVKNAYDCPLFLKSDDEKYGVQTRNILCFPVCTNGKVFGVVQLCNKQLGDFNVFDEEAMTSYGLYCGISVQQALAFKRTQETVYRNKISTELLLYHLQVKDSDIKHMLYAQKPKCEKFGQITFNAREIPLHRTTLFVMMMFEQLGFMETFKIEKKTLATFILFVFRGYRNQPYHNWMHAFSVTHFAFSVIKTFELTKKKILSDLEAMSIIIACLCHDIDHRGAGNFNIARPTVTLNSLYTNVGSVLERHHLSQTMCILNTDGCNFLSNLDEKHYARCLELIKHNILATNISTHTRSMKKQELLLTRVFNQHNSEHKIMLCSLLMVCADLSDQTRGWKISRTVAAQLYEEYFRQGDLEKAMGREPIEIIDRDKASIPDLQIEFLRDTCLPAFSVLTKLFPDMEFAVQSVLYNIRCWEASRQFFIYRNLMYTNSLEILNSKALSLTESKLCILEMDEGRLTPEKEYSHYND